MRKISYLFIILIILSIGIVAGLHFTGYLLNNQPIIPPGSDIEWESFEDIFPDEKSDESNMELFPRREMMDLVVVHGQARGIIVRNLVSGELESHAADAVVLATGGYGNVYYLSTNAESSNVGGCFRAYKQGAAFPIRVLLKFTPPVFPIPVSTSRNY